MLSRLFAPILVMAASTALAQIPASPYAGQQNRVIKALSAEDIRDLAEERGMGMAKAAELNGYPGPAHVLELAAPLQLTTEQRAATEAIYQRMLGEAKRLGGAILAAESDLDRRFQHRHIDPASLRAATASVAALTGELRAVHLAAHLEQNALLTPTQITEYQRQRGYLSTAPDSGHTGRHRH